MPLLPHLSLLLPLLLPLLLLLPSCSPRADLNCSSLLGSTRKPGPACILPFRLDGKMRFECTTSYRPGKQVLPHHLIGRPLCPIADVDPVSLEAPTAHQSWAPCSNECLLLDYRTNERLWQDLKELASSFPSLASTFVIGASLEGRPLMGITVGARSQLRPRVRLYSGLAGDQATGRELLAHTATHLLHSYGKDRDVTNLLERVQISFLPSANPDGFPKARKGSCSGGRRREGERNAADVSLETDFPTAGEYDRFQVEEEYDPYEGRQPETTALMDWSVSEPWLLGVHLQDGAVAVTYPFHNPLDGAGDGPHNTADEKELIHLANTLIEARDDSRSKCYFRPEEELMNGAEFQAEFSGKRGGGLGSVEDFSYLFTGSLDLRLGVSCCKYPVRYSLTKEWERQRDGLLAVIQQANRGVKGVVYLPDNTPAPFTDLMVWDPEGQLRQKNGTTSVQGEYWRYLLPALRHYTLQAVLDDCQGSGLRFASPRLQVLVTERRPLATQLVFLRHVGYCKGAVVPSKYSDLVDEFGIFHRETDFTLVNSEL